MTLDCPGEFGDEDVATCRGVADQLETVGIEVAVNFLSTDELYGKLYTDRQSDFFLEASSMEPDPERMLRERFTQDFWNVTGYANPRVDQLIEKIETEMVTYARDAYLEEVWKIVTGDAVYLPIRHSVSVFALQENLEIPPDPWGVPRFRLARFKEESKPAQQWAGPPSGPWWGGRRRGEYRAGATETKKYSLPRPRRRAS